MGDNMKYKNTKLLLVSIALFTTCTSLVACSSSTSTSGEITYCTLIQELKPMEMDPFLKDYIINKGKQKITFAENEKELYFSMLNKKKDP